MELDIIMEKLLNISNELNTISICSRYKRFGHLAEFKNGFVLGKLVHTGKILHL